MSLHLHPYFVHRECSGSVVECLTSDRGFEPHRRHCVVSLSKNINPSLVLVQPRKTRPFITERLLMGRKESNQTKIILCMLATKDLVGLHKWAGYPESSLLAYAKKPKSHVLIQLFDVLWNGQI